MVKSVAVDCDVYTDAADGSLAIATVALADRSGWTMFSAVEQKQVSQTVDTAAGADTTVDIVRTSQSHAASHLQEVCTCDTAQ